MKFGCSSGQQSIMDVYFLHFAVSKRPFILFTRAKYSAKI